MRVREKVFTALLMMLSLIVVARPVFAQDENWNWRDGIPKYEEAKVKIVEDGPTLLFSDSPEMVKASGIMYQDRVLGDVRLFFHHVNDTDSLKKIAVIFRNVDKYPAKIEVGRKGISEPDFDYLRAGKEVQKQYFAEHKTENHILLKNSSLEVLTGNGISVMPGQLVTGMLDFSCDKLTEVTVIMLSPEMEISTALKKSKILPPDEGTVLRGTFPLANRLVTLKQSYKPDEDKIIGIVLADNVLDPYARGIDATTGKETINYGNYGVVYDFSYKIKGDPRTNIRFNPWGGWFAGAGAVIKDGREIMTMLPAESTAFGKKGTETIIITSAKGYSDGRIIFSPPGASNLPIRFFFETVKN